MIASTSFLDSDFVPMAAFGRAWRFTDPKFALLPPEVLARVRPLQPAVATILNSAAATLHVVTTAKASVTIDTRLPNTPSNDTSVRDALTALEVPGATPVIVSWDGDDAVVTDWQIFVEYWDDFCYPSSDDVTVWPAILHSRDSWALAYNHYETFCYIEGAI